MLLQPDRVVITGVPRSGKTTLATNWPGTPERYHTDDLAGVMAWSEVSEHVAGYWMSAAGPWLIEGVAAIRALRKWIATHSSGKPADLVVWMPQERMTLSSGQYSLAKGTRTIWQGLRPELLARGVAIEERY